MRKMELHYQFANFFGSKTPPTFKDRYAHQSAMRFCHLVHNAVDALPAIATLFNQPAIQGARESIVCEDAQIVLGRDRDIHIASID
jgi:hypothetical protein